MSCHWGRARKNLRVQYPKPPFLGSRGLAPRCSCRVQSETGRVNLQEGHPPAAPHLPGAGRKVEMQGFLPSRALGRQGWADRVVVASSSPVPGRAGLPATADRGQLSHGPGAPGFGVGGRWEELLPSENTPPAPPQASGATFTEVALRVGEGGTPHPRPHTRAASRDTGHSCEWTQPWAEWLGLSAAPARTPVECLQTSLGCGGPSPRSILTWSGIDASVSLPPPQGAGGPKPKLPPLCGPGQPCLPATTRHGRGRPPGLRMWG